MRLLKIRGIHVPHRKNTSAMTAVRMSPPDSVTIPMSMHIGAPCSALVKVGDTVSVGDIIAQPGGYVSAPIHASISGKVRAIGDYLLSNGITVPAVTIESDGEMRLSKKISPPDVGDYESFVEAVKQSGAVGLGGAGFPSFIKLSVKDFDSIKTVVINGAECEPYITSDTRTMLDRSDDIRFGIELLEKFLGVKRIIIGIESNKRECIDEMKRINSKDPTVSVVALPASYPQGGEKVLIHNTVGVMVPEGKLPIDVGVIVLNCTTLAFIAAYIRTGIPLVEKCVTVDGSAVKEPKNIIVPIGASIGDVFGFAGGFIEEPHKVLYGGPMMGISVPSLSDPVLKNTNALLAFNKKDSVLQKTTPCIRCGNCVSHCPLNLDPRAISKAVEAESTEKLGKLKVNICMECGCCSYVCPAVQPLVQRNRLAKAMLKAKQAKRAEIKKKIHTESDSTGKEGETSD